MVPTAQPTERQSKPRRVRKAATSRAPHRVPSAEQATWTVDEFVRDAGIIFAKEPFYENGIVNHPESYGNMAQVFSSYESRRAPGEKAFERGINSLQVLNDGSRWWIVSIFWDSERADNPLPAKMAKK